MLFVTHDLQLASAHGSHVALFVDGGVIAGTRDEVMNEGNLGRAYGVSSGVRPQRTEPGATGRMGDSE
jgi:ABC-type cobalamin/Fe3+-siderophores transport system ATPase subunit